MKNNKVNRYEGEGSTTLDFTSVNFAPDHVAAALIWHAFSLGVKEGIHRSRAGCSADPAICNCPVTDKVADVPSIIEVLDGELALLLTNMRSRLTAFQVATERARAELERLSR